MNTIQKTILLILFILTGCNSTKSIYTSTPLKMNIGKSIRTPLTIVGAPSCLLNTIKTKNMLFK